MKDTKARLYKDVEFLTEIYPPRNHENTESIEEAASYIEAEFSKLSCIVENQYFTVNGYEYRNVIASFNPGKDKRLIVGAHYDVAGDTPGADDNASAIAGLLECARILDEHKPELDYRIDFVAYCLEEPPYFGTSEMGSAVHAKSLLQIRKEVIGMICLEMIGYFSDTEPQEYPLAGMHNHYPAVGNFIIVAGRNDQKEFAEKITDIMRSNSSVDTFLITDPRLAPLLSLSDHSNYWKYGFNAVMINDTSSLRNNNYHKESDTIDTLDFTKMAEVIKGCYNAIIGF